MCQGACCVAHQSLKLLEDCTFQTNSENLLHNLYHND